MFPNVRSRAAALTIALALLTGCGGRPAPPKPAEPLPAPTPPAGAATGLPIPQRQVDGGFATINSGLGESEAAWHVRAALNVAALSCRGDDAIIASYNQLLARQKAPLAAAYRGEAGRFDDAGAMDRHMTQLYNFFAQPPAQAGFCRAAKAETGRIGAVSPAEFPAYAAQAIGRLEAPVLDFYRAYDAYRRDLAQWRANPRATQVAVAAPVAKLAAAEPTISSWRIQIGAFSGRAAAEAAWARARKTAPSLARYRPHYEPAPGRPELVRVQLGSEDDRDGALRLCASAAAAGFDCIPMPRR